MRGVQELVGHQSLAMTQRYSHLSPAALARRSGCSNSDPRIGQLETVGDAEGVKRLT
jgi:hypothetical protein